MSEANFEALKAAYDAFGRGDHQAMFALLEPGVRWDATKALTHRGTYRGPTGVAQYLTRLAEGWDDFRLEVKEFVETSPGLYMVSGTARGLERATRAPVRAAFVHVLRLRHGKVSHVEIFVDRSKAVEAITRV